MLEMKLLFLLAIYVVPIIRFFRCIFSIQLKRKIQNESLFQIACFIYGILAFTSVGVVFTIATLGRGGASGVPLAFLLPVQTILIILAEVLIARSKMSGMATIKTRKFRYPKIKPVIVSDANGIKLLKESELTYCSEENGRIIKTGFDKTRSKFYFLVSDQDGDNEENHYFSNYELMTNELCKQTGLVIHDFLK